VRIRREASPSGAEELDEESSAALSASGSELCEDSSLGDSGSGGMGASAARARTVGVTAEPPPQPDRLLVANANTAKVPDIRRARASIKIRLLQGVRTISPIHRFPKIPKTR